MMILIHSYLCLHYILGNDYNVDITSFFNFIAPIATVKIIFMRFMKILNIFT